MTLPEIEVLLWYYVCPLEFPRFNDNKDVIASLVEREILIWRPRLAPDIGRFVVTKKGEKLVQMLCDTPDPVQEWFDPRIKPDP